MREQFKEILGFYWQSLQMWWLTRRAIAAEPRAQWIFSGVRQDSNGFFSDIGYVRSAHPMKQHEAEKHLVKNFPRATVKHIDPRNRIITYTIS